MKMVKSLLLGTAAGLVAVAGAQAADLPVKAKPVQYVKICSLYGAGFYYMPGTDTCLKVGGFVRAETIVNGGGSFSQLVDGNFDSRALHRMSWRARAAITFDARSQTEYGTLRSYIQFGYNHTSGTGGGDAIYSNRVFIQWAGFTAGLAQSFFDAFGFSAYSNQTNILTSDTGGGGHLVWAYTAQLGNGLSASVSIEDPANRRATAGATGVGLGGIVGAGGYGGNNLPDLVANLRIDQAWGSAQVMGALHQVYPLAAGYENEIGYAVGAYVKVNLPMLGAGDNISAQVAYGKGATGYNFRSGNFALTNDSTTATGLVTDAVAGAPGQSLELTESWSVGAGFQHAWNKQWKTSIYGGYGAINYSDTAETYLGTAAGLSSDFTFWQAGTRTVWTPVANLDLSVDVIYNNINTSSAPNGLNRGLPVDDQGWFAGIFRAQRNFYP